MPSILYLSTINIIPVPADSAITPPVCSVRGSSLSYHPLSLSLSLSPPGRNSPFFSLHAVHVLFHIILYILSHSLAWMFRLLPWSSTLGGFNINHKMLATPPSCTSANTISLDPTTLSLPKSQLKRKRSPSTSTDTAIAQDAPAATRLRPDQATQINFSSFNNNNDKHIPVAPPSPLSQATVPPSPSTPVASRPKAIDTDKLRETLEAQLSLEVLLKHNELRLIDQEIAKSQVALEQLRRCSEIPYPGSQVAGVSTSLSNGTGMAVCPPGNGPVPSSPAPWGVTDGPYSRHYAKWLLPDPRFDGGQLEDVSSPWSAAPMPGMTAPTGLPNVEGRSTRGNPGDNGALASTARPQRGSASGSKLQALPSGYAAPKERAGPMIIRRKSDGVFVKLVCLDCRRDNFSSTQGFINHCRIAHNRNFASHDAAAVASGEPVELDEAGAVVGGSKTETSSSPPAAPGYVHPLVRSAHVIEPSQTPAATAATPRQRSSSMVETPRNPSTHKRNMSETINNTSSFLASPATPHLSSLMKHQGAGVDLGQLVGEAKATVDLEAYSSADEDDGSDDDSALPATDANVGTEVRASRQPMRTVGSAATASQQPSTRTGRKPPSLESLTPVRPGPSYISPYGPTPTTDEHVDGMDLSANLSPHTVESNQAPSLVSDDDDDDGEAVSECGSPGPTSSVDGDGADQEFSHINVEDDDDDATTSAAATAEPKNGPPGLASPAPTTTSLSNPLRRSNHHAQTKKDRFISSSTPVPAPEEGKEEKHVSFVSPEMSPDTSPSKGKKGDERK